MFSKVQVLCNNITGTVTASSSAPSVGQVDYSAGNVLNPLENDLWKAPATPVQTETLTFQPGAAFAANAIFVNGHNLATVGGNIKVLTSDDSWTSSNTIIENWLAPNNKCFLRPFSSVSALE